MSECGQTLEVHFFKSAIGRVAPPVLKAGHMNFFRGLRLSPEGKPPIRLLKNVFDLAPVFPVDVSLIAEARVCDAICAIADVTTLQAQIDRAFSFPYQPGETSYRADPCYREGDSSEVSLARFAAAYACDPPDTELRELVVADTPADHPDSVSFDVAGLGMFGVSDRTVTVVPGLLRQRGIMFSCGFVCTRAVRDLLEPLLRRPYFVVIELENPRKS